MVSTSTELPLTATRSYDMKAKYTGTYNSLQHNLCTLTSPSSCGQNSWNNREWEHTLIPFPPFDSRQEKLSTRAVVLDLLENTEHIQNHDRTKHNKWKENGNVWKMTQVLLPVCPQSPQDTKALKASSMANVVLHRRSLTWVSCPINGLRAIQQCMPLWDISKWFEIAFDQSFDEVACLILGVSFRNVHHKGLQHQGPHSSINDLWMEGNDWRVVLRRKESHNRTTLLAIKKQTQI